MCWKKLRNRLIIAYQNINSENKNEINSNYISGLSGNLNSSFQLLKNVNDERDRLHQRKAARLQAIDNKFLLDIHSSSGTILMVVDKKTEEIININHTFTRILEYSLQDVIGKIHTQTSIWVNQQDPITIKYLLQYAQVIKQQIFQLRTKSGEIKSFLLSAEEIYINKQACIFFMASDITNITQYSYCVSYRCLNDADWTMKYISSDCEKLTGYKVGELVGNNIVSYGDMVHPNDSKYVWETVQQALAKQKAYEISYRIITKSKAIKYIWERGQGIFSSSSSNTKSLHLEGLIEDVTELKLYEEKLTQQRKSLRTQIQETIKGLEENSSGLNLLDEIPVLLDALNVATIEDIAALANPLTSKEILDDIESDLYLVIIALAKASLTIQYYLTLTEPAKQDKILFTAKQELQAVTKQINDLSASLKVLINQIVTRWKSVIDNLNYSE
ncbi:putative PAS/PAC sensor protein [Calothrix parasitica NIES-267]|uniref:histidine kinase n=1 Tax=Calothrix parasitica NIES-267 TaxID=1973488 RepID=A0A1Z4LJM9_9CYAN|nr:putative PAS/PAC sensor protein [Calothrix parasitica NIES-267]